MVVTSSVNSSECKKLKHKIQIGASEYHACASTKKQAEAERDEFLVKGMFDGQDISPVVVQYTLHDGTPSIAVLYRELDGRWSYNLHAQDGEAYKGYTSLVTTDRRTAVFSMRRHIAGICQGDGWMYIHPHDTEGIKNHADRLKADKLYNCLRDAGISIEIATDLVVFSGERPLDELIAKGKEIQAVSQPRLNSTTATVTPVTATNTANTATEQPKTQETPPQTETETPNNESSTKDNGNVGGNGDGNDSSSNGDKGSKGSSKNSKNKSFASVLKKRRTNWRTLSENGFG